MPFPFEVPFEKVKDDLDTYVDAVFGALSSEFLTLPKGGGFVDYPVFREGYEALKQATLDFSDLTPESVIKAVHQTPIAFVVLRTMLGFSPPEWAYITTKETDTEVPQSAIRSLDRKVRMAPHDSLQSERGVTSEHIRALVKTACRLLEAGAPPERNSLIHRLDKADTREGLASLHRLAVSGVPYAQVLYERFLGRPFASHRDSVSELVGEVLETAIEDVMSKTGIPFRRIGRGESIRGFDQAPDFIVPSEENPKVVIEAKISEDDGTARDKITRVQHLASLAREGLEATAPPHFEVIACIAGRGFKVRREDMKKLLLATRGKVFTLENIELLVNHSKLKEFRTR